MTSQWGGLISIVPAGLGLCGFQSAIDDGWKTMQEEGFTQPAESQIIGRLIWLIAERHIVHQQPAAQWSLSDDMFSDEQPLVLPE